MDKTLAVQLQIRQNAEEISSALKEIQGWEKAVKNKDKALQKRSAAPVRSRDTVRTAGGTVPIKSTQAPNQSSVVAGMCFKSWENPLQHIGQTFIHISTRIHTYTYTYTYT
ncbi:hypothetical protein EON65_55380 [archaeon]|nr:MAG: hypothetical protein EON65_55380 [archaeon]